MSVTSCHSWLSLCRLWLLIAVGQCSRSAPQLLFTSPSRASHNSHSFVKLAGFLWFFQNHLFLLIFSWLLECCGCFLWAQSWKVVLVPSVFQTNHINLGEPWVKFACDWASVPWPTSRHNCLNCLWTSIVLNRASYPGYGGGMHWLWVKNLKMCDWILYCDSVTINSN